VSGFSPLLIELGTEELPVKALPGLAQAFFDGVIAGFEKRGIACQRGGAKPLYTPRRLAVLLPGVAVEQPEQRGEVLGPYLNIALDADGKPTKALEGFAAKAGIDWTALEKTTDNKGERFVLRTVKPGAKTADLLPEIVAEALAGMPIPKPMRWGARDSGFARPVHWLVLLLGDAVVDAQVFGAKADRMSRGHRFHHEGPVWISTPGDYIDALRAAKVLVDPEERRHRVVAEVDAAAARAGGTARKTDDNLEQVQCLVEWPKAVLCAFEREFLAVPQEALIATMEANQKFFPVLDADGKLTEHFIGIANIESKDESEVRKGYERVIRPRFADAKFFFDEDLKQGLASMNEGLKTVTYQAKLGTVWDKAQRVAALAESTATEVGVDPKLARRAAELAKADLQSRMVNEFPELQGIAGRYYAMHDASLNDLSAEERRQLADALDEVYMPRFAGDAIAPSKLGQVLAIAERLDTLEGGFHAGLRPTGNKDPFSLRRNALGLARTIVEAGLELDLADRILRLVMRHPAGTVRGAPVDFEKEMAEAAESKARDILDFILDRLRAYYADQSVTPQQFESVAALKPASLLDFDRRLKAIGEFAKLPDAEALAAANKRIRNILKKADIAIPDAVDASKFQDAAERALHAVVEQAIADTDPLLANRDYVAVLARLARLRPEVDTFFDKVMVNADDQAVRANRLALLQHLADRLGSVAAIEHLSV
jgi:glycyl-tRNA synthetase beta chain